MGLKKKLRQNPQVAQVDLKMGPPTCYPHDTPTMCYPFMTSVKPCYPSWTTPRLPLKPPSLFPFGESIRIPILKLNSQFCRYFSTFLEKNGFILLYRVTSKYNETYENSKFSTVIF